jgi:hypothetical protein
MLLDPIPHREGKRLWSIGNQSLTEASQTGSWRISASVISSLQHCKQVTMQETSLVVGFVPGTAGVEIRSMHYVFSSNPWINH